MTAPAPTQRGVAKPDSWVKVRWDAATECFSIDLYFETAPPGNQQFMFALGRQEARELKSALTLALSRRATRSRKIRVKR